MRLFAVVLLTLGLAGCQAPDERPAASTPIVILVSFDGWRWDFLDKVEAPVLAGLAARGVRAHGLVPVFPALTFPNHYTIVTGLRPARHGIVSNVMRDPAIPGRFTLSDTSVTADPRWWSGEPVWNAATRQGQKSATMFWPGSDVAIGGQFPTYWRQFDHDLPPERRTDQVLEWLGLSEGERPTLVTLYYSDVDSAGHDNGPDSPAVYAAAARLDRELGRLVAGVAALGLEERVHWIVVSDHGMASSAAERVIVLDDYLDVDTVELLYVGAMLTLNPVSTSLDVVDAALRGRHPHLRVFRSAELPARFGLAGHPRLSGIVALADEGWVVTTRERLSRRAAGRPWGGEHGYDPQRPSMHGLFVASGPRLKPGLVVSSFETVHVYALLCEILGLTPAPNDGDLSVVRPWLR